ncbi:MAG: hypothetical protein IJ464_04185 [Alistipes sp.]|nr:hypothetical protein [Alistipes sp.]
MNETIYTAPALTIEDVMVERGFNLSGFGDNGEPGQDSGYNDYDDEL